MRQQTLAKDIEFKPPFVRTECVLGGFLPLLYDYNYDRCFIRKPKWLLREIDRKYETSKFGPSPNTRNNFDLLESGSGENSNLWLAKALHCSRWT